MASASGPVETSSGKMEFDDFLAPEPPRQRQESKNNEETKRNEFKVPEPSTSQAGQKKPDPSESKEPNVAGNGDEQKSRTRTTALSPAVQKQTQVSVPYQEPIWGGLPPESEQFSFDVLKNGTVIDNINLGHKPWIVFGRLPSCDVSMEHPSLSRHHAVVQYREVEEEGQERGWYLYDLDSTHGTWVNKEKIKPKEYRRLHVGHVIKFGGSTRLYILQGPEADQEPESELSVTELKKKTAQLKRESELRKQAEMEEEEEKERQRQKIQELRGCSWGMGEDATEEEEPPPTSLTPQHEHLYRDDPKKALKGFYEREGCDLPDYQFSEAGFGKHKCTVELPVDGPNGEVLVAEVTVSGKKKEAVVACAMEACRLLDLHGMLHASKHESRKRKSKNWADDDFYDSDEDTFLDRTGSIEKKRILRMRKSGKGEQAETYDTLVPKYEDVQKRIAEIEGRLAQAKADSEASKAGEEEEDALEAYMRGIRAGGMDTSTRLALKRQLLELRTEEQRLSRLVHLARPTHLPPLLPTQTAAKTGLTSGTRKIGSVKGPSKPTLPPVKGPAPQSLEEDFQEEEEEEEEEEQESKASDSSKSTAATPQDSASHLANPSSNSNSSVPEASSSSPSSSSFPHKPFSESPQTKVKHDSQTAHKKPVSKTSQDLTVSEPVQEANTVPQTVQTEKRCVPQSATQGADSQGSQSSVLSSIQALASAKAAALKAADSKDTKRADRCSVRGPEKSKSALEDSSEKVWKKPPAKRREKNAPAQAKKGGDYDDSDPNYAMWMPPQDQSGDGRTSLNDKLGY